MRTYGPNHWNPPRTALCTCGWARKFPTLAATVPAVKAHIAEGCEGCDHAVDIFLTESPK
jgi:hypothetical protein